MYTTFYINLMGIRMLAVFHKYRARAVITQIALVRGMPNIAEFIRLGDQPPES